MLDLGRMMGHMPGLPNFLWFYVILYWSHALRRGIARGVFKGGHVLALILVD